MTLVVPRRNLYAPLVNVRGGSNNKENRRAGQDGRGHFRFGNSKFCRGESQRTHISRRNRAYESQEYRISLRIRWCVLAGLGEILELESFSHIVS